MTKNAKPVPVSSGRPPIVAVLGHVDHGKTSLLDFIRKSHVTAKEHGGITQHIGAYQVHTKNLTPVKSGDTDRLITFIDTPGHEAFIKMRSRGAQVADIAVLVVAADDSVKPQTLESIRVIQAAKIPMIVAMNKMDLPAANPERVKKDLAKAGVQVEGFGGDVPIVPVSAKAGTGVSDLLEMILLVADMKDVGASRGGEAGGIVIETRVDKGKGMVATLVVVAGQIAVGEPLYDGTRQVAKLRAMFDENGESVRQAPPGKPVECLGFSTLPTVGTRLTTRPTAGTPVQQQATPAKGAADNLPDFLRPINPDEEKRLKIILKADTAGSLEAILGSLIATVDVVARGIGDITEADVLQAKATGAIIIGFGVKAGGSVVKLAQTEKVIYRTYAIIYELLDELVEVLEGMNVEALAERDLGTGTIVAQFPYEDMIVAGTKVTSGRLARGDAVKIMRGEAEIGRGKIKSLRVGKEDVSKVSGGSECGILLDRKLAFTTGDGIIAFTTG